MVYEWLIAKTQHNCSCSSIIYMKNSLLKSDFKCWSDGKWWCKFLSLVVLVTMSRRLDATANSVECIREKFSVRIVEANTQYIYKDVVRNHFIEDNFFSSLDVSATGVNIPDLDSQNYIWTTAFFRSNDVIDKYNSNIVRLEWIIEQLIFINSVSGFFYGFCSENIISTVFFRFDQIYVVYLLSVIHMCLIGSMSAPKIFWMQQRWICSTFHTTRGAMHACILLLLFCMPTRRLLGAYYCLAARQTAQTSIPRSSQHHPCALNVFIFCFWVAVVAGGGGDADNDEPGYVCVIRALKTGIFLSLSLSSLFGSGLTIEMRIFVRLSSVWKISEARAIIIK